MTADVAIQRVNARHGTRFAVEGRCPGGEVGAYFLNDDEGRFVCKWSENPASEQRLEALIRTLCRLHDEGYPLPRYGPVLAFEGGVLIVQEVVSGRYSDTVSDTLVERLIEIQKRQIGLGHTIDPEPWGRFLLRTLRVGADGWALHEPLREHSDQTRRLVEWIEKLGGQLDEKSFPDKDLVHIDFHHRNALQSEQNELTAVVDWEGARQGDAAFDVVTLAFGLAAADCTAEARRRAWEAAVGAAGERLLPYVAHMALRRLDWTIRFHQEELQFWLNVCGDFIERAHRS